MTASKGSGSLWGWLHEDSNRKLLAWVGSGVIAIAGGLGTLFGIKPSDTPSPPPQEEPRTSSQDRERCADEVQVGGDGIAIGCDGEVGDVTFK